MPHIIKQKSARKSLRVSSSIIKIFILIVVVGFCLYYSYFFIKYILLYQYENPIENSEKVRLNNNDEIEKTVYIITEGDSNIIKVFVTYVNENSMTTRGFVIPSWVYVVEYSGNYDNKVSVENLLYIGKNLNEKKKYEYVVWQVQNILGSSFDNYVFIDKEFENILDLKSEINVNEYNLFADFNSITYLKIFMNLKDISDVQERIKSNLTPLGLYSQISKFRRYNKNEQLIDLSTGDYLNDEIYTDGRGIKSLNFDKLDTEILKYNEFYIPFNVSSEQVKIEVYNGSGVSKAAGRYSRLIGNMGAKVVRTANAPNEMENTTIYMSKPDIFPKSLNLVKSIFSKEPEIIYARPDFMSTGDIVVILGKDISKEVDWI